MKKVACVLSTAPYGCRTVRDALDAVMVCAAFDMPPALFFMDNGIMQLIKKQEAHLISQKNHGAMLKSLLLYDINTFWACHASMVARGLDAGDCVLPIKTFERKQLAALLSEYDVVMTF